MIGERIRELRQTQGRSLADVAARAKVSVATLSRIENGKQSVDLGLFLVLAKVLDVPPAEFLGDGASGDDGSVDPLARRIAALDPKKRAALWRDVAAERRTMRGRSRAASMADAVQQLEELLAQVDFLREELATMRRQVRRR